MNSATLLDVSIGSGIELHLASNALRKERRRLQGMRGHFR